jgi:hypothetical protein
MKIQASMGVGMLLILLPCFSMGVSFLDTGTWPPLNDLRWGLILLGVLLVIAGSVLFRRASPDRE